MAWFWGNEEGELTAILDSDGDQLFETAGLLGVQIDESKSFSTHTLENGEIATDNVIDNQNRINLQIILDPDDYVEVFQEIKTLFDSSEAISVQVRVDTYTNLYIESIPHDEGPEIANTVGLSLTLVEQQFSSTASQDLSSSDVSNVSDQSTIKSGQKTSTESTTVLDDWLGGLL